jgi:hypothetical protein
MCVRVCVYVCMYACYICVYICMYVCMYYVCVYIYMYKTLKTMSHMPLLKEVLINNWPRQIRQKFPS